MTAALLAAAALALAFALIVVRPRLRERRRAALRKLPVPAPWRHLLERSVPLIRRLPPQLRDELYAHVQVLLAEKRFEGCDGLVLGEPHRLLIAGLAALLLLGRPVRYFARLRSILVYPGAFLSERRTAIDEGFVIHEEEARSGESWQHGSVIVSWSELTEDLADRRGARNVVLHEFAHQLDAENGAMDAVPWCADAQLQLRLDTALPRAAEVFARAVDAGRPVDLDDYAAVEPAEFFAVATETFFCAPQRLQRYDAQLYALLTEFYRVDPLLWAQRRDDLH